MNIGILIGTRPHGQLIIVWQPPKKSTVAWGACWLQYAERPQKWPPNLQKVLALTGLCISIDQNILKQLNINNYKTPADLSELLTSSKPKVGFVWKWVYNYWGLSSCSHSKCHSDTPRWFIPRHRWCHCLYHLIQSQPSDADGRQYLRSWSLSQALFVKCCTNTIKYISI